MSDPFESYVDTLDGPARHAAEVTPSDTVDIAVNARALWIGQSGNLRVTTVGGEVVNFTSVISGAIMPVRISRVHATGTTATNIIALW